MNKMRINGIKILAVIFLVNLYSVGFAQKDMLCMGAHWTEDEGAAMLKKWALEWNTQDEWEGRAETIGRG